MMPSPRHLPLLPGDRIFQGWPISTTNMDQDLQQILSAQLVSASQRPICHPNAVPDELQCVGHISSMILLNQLLPVRRPRSRFFSRWQIPRVRHLCITSHIATEMMPLSICPRSSLFQRNATRTKVFESLKDPNNRNSRHI